MYIFLVVKGSHETAQAQATARGITLEIEGNSSNGNETYCVAPFSDRPKIIDWYCEDRGFAKVSQPGECLWYAERK